MKNAISPSPSDSHQSIATLSDTDSVGHANARVTTSPVSYDQDFALWLESTVQLPKAGAFTGGDGEHGIEELEGLTRSDQRELENCLITLLEQAHKRCYAPLPDCYRG